MTGWWLKHTWKKYQNYWSLHTFKKYCEYLNFKNLLLQLCCLDLTHMASCKENIQLIEEVDIVAQPKSLISLVPSIWSHTINFKSVHLFGTEIFNKSFLYYSISGKMEKSKKTRSLYWIETKKPYNLCHIYIESYTKFKFNLSVGSRDNCNKIWMDGMTDWQNG